MEPRIFDNTIIRRGHYSECTGRIIYSTTSDVAHKLFCYKSSKSASKPQIALCCSNSLCLTLFISLRLAPSRSVSLCLTLSHSVSLSLSVSLCLTLPHSLTLSHSISFCLTLSHSVSLCLTLSHICFTLSHYVSYLSHSVSLCISLYHSVSLCLTLSHWRGTYFAKSLLASRFSTKHVEKHIYMYLYVCVKSEVKRTCGATYR